MLLVAGAVVALPAGGVYLMLRGRRRRAAGAGAMRSRKEGVSTDAALYLRFERLAMYFSAGLALGVYPATLLLAAARDGERRYDELGEFAAAWPGDASRPAWHDAGWQLLLVAGVTGWGGAAFVLRRWQLMEAVAADPLALSSPSALTVVLEGLTRDTTRDEQLWATLPSGLGASPAGQGADGVAPHTHSWGPHSAAQLRPVVGPLW